MTEILFLPGFDGAGRLRSAFVEALGKRHPARAIAYPNRTLDTLRGYARFAAAEQSDGDRVVLVAESFSGLVAAKWAARDPRIAGIVLCGAFARSPVPWAAFGASMPGIARFLGASVMAPIGMTSADPVRRRWGEALGDALRALDRDVIAERLRLIALSDVRPELGMLRIPVVLAQFEDDLVIGPRARAELEEACPGAQVVRVPGPHFAIETRPRETADAILPRISGWFE
jgi:pimeloyl-ACP methyl ester carboxylesterase